MLRRCRFTEWYHVWEGIYVNGLIFVGYTASDVANFDQDFVGYLALNGDVKGINHVGPEMRVQGFTRSCGDVVDAREIGLRQRGAGGRYRSGIAVNTNTEGSHRSRRS